MVSSSSVFLGLGKHEMLGDMGEAHYFLLSDDVAVVFDLAENRLCLSVVLVVCNALFMPLNVLFSADFDVGWRARA